MSKASPPDPTPHSSRSAVAGIALACLAVGVGWWLWRAPTPPPPRPAAGEVVLDAMLDLGQGPIDRRLLAPYPSIFRVEVSSSSDVTVTLGPPLPSTNAAEGGPDPAVSTVLKGTAGRGIAADVRVYTAGIHVLRIEATGPSAGQRTASLRVRRVRGP